MARKERIQEPGQYHIINRGVERRKIFLEAEDFEFFLDLLVECTKKYEIIVHTFCLMSNHYHLLLETKHHNLSKTIQFLNNIYTKYFNKKYKRVGYLWQGRYKSYPLYDDAQFWIVAKYIERNPIKANMVKKVENYRFQSFFQRKHKHTYYELLNGSMIFEMTLEEYSNYVEEELHVDAIDIVYDSPKVILKDDKLKVLKKRLNTFFEHDIDINRDENMKKAFEYGYSKSEIARFLELSPSTVSKIL